MLHPFLGMLREGPLRVDHLPGPLGLMHHLCDAYVELLVEVSTGGARHTLDAATTTDLLMPFLEVRTVLYAVMCWRFVAHWCFVVCNSASVCVCVSVCVRARVCV